MANREGSVGGTEFGDIDNITLTYNGNRLMSANDLSDPNHQNYGFVDNHSYGSKEYDYDPNGNMVFDDNKKLIEVKYNHLNLPTRLILNRGSDFDQIFYQYDAVGNKLCKQATKSGAPVNTTRYFPTFETESGTLKHIFTAEGKAVPMKKGFEYQYFIKDHLGNTRVVLNQTGKTLQQNSYYPFGMLMAGLPQNEEANTNKYLYNGKELQDDFGLDWYDYGARFYDAEVGRFHTVDPYSELDRKWSPYNYTFNNPLRFTDPDGMWPDGNPLENLVDYVVDEAKSYIANKVEGLVHTVAREIGHQVKEESKKIEVSAYAEGEVKLSAGANRSEKVKGLGVDANVMTAEIASISGDIDNKGGNGEVSWVGKDGELTVEHGGSAGYEGADIDASHSYTVKQGEGIVQSKSSIEGSYGIPGLTVGAKYEKSNNTKSKITTHTVKEGIFTGGAIGSGWRLSFAGSAGFKISYKKSNDD